jgi:hypothetical protein
MVLDALSEIYENRNTVVKCTIKDGKITQLSSNTIKGR